ncbi:MAG: DNA-3-methyladenine glycosylase family protein [Pseudomonadota bacterium]
MDGRIISGPEDLAEGADWLAARDPRLASVIAACGPLPLRRVPAGFPALVDAIVGQQVSTASARAILARLRAAGLDRPGALGAAPDEALRGCGLSRPKIRCLRALAEAGPDFDAIGRMPEDRAVAALVALPGIGRWTAEIYLMFAEGRADVFAAGDLALQEAARMVWDRPERPREAELRALAEAWRPWRAVAARALWAYYRLAKSQEGVP